MTKEQYILSFVAHITKLQCKYDLLNEELELCRGHERTHVEKLKQGIKMQITKSGSVYTGLCTGRLKPWEDGKVA